MKKKEERVRAEEERIFRILDEAGVTKKALVEGLVHRAAHLRVTLEDLSEDLDKNGYTEMFQQSEKLAPYERKRPSADLYNVMNGLYQKAMKQLTDLLPKEKAGKADDGFDGFISSRD